MQGAPAGGRVKSLDAYRCQNRGGATMPEKPLAERIKRAKREGVAVAIKKDDLGPVTDKSPHSVKKSRGIVDFEPPPDRRAGLKAAPGRGRNRTAQAVSSPLPKKRRRGENPERAPEITARHVAPVRGRKKSPSEMHIYHPGG